MKRKIIWSFALLACLCCLPSAKTKAQTKNAAIIPGEVWKDTDGNPINAHGGGLLYHEGTYYWYGEYKKGETILPEWATWECYRTDVTGVSCYSSKDLLNWKFEGIVLPAVKDDEKHDLHPSKVLERPKVIYNEKTKKFVMWAHVESADYSKACAGVAVSDSPTGTFTYVGSFRPNGAMSRDQTVFVDDNGKAYQFYSSENNATLYISELTDDYLKPTGRYTRNFVKQSREAPAVFKYNGKYYMLSSGCTGWDPNVAELAVADSIMGQWTTIGNPCTGPDADKTFYAQSTYVQQVYGKGNAYIAMFDRWKKKNLEDSRYVWLPLEFGKDGTIAIPWRDSWDPRTQWEGQGDFSAGKGTFLLNGKPFVIKAAELHYPRIPKAYWDQRIKLCKALGMNTICLYVFWNSHESQPGVFDFTGQNVCHPAPGTVCLCRMGNGRTALVVTQEKRYPPARIRPLLYGACRYLRKSRCRAGSRYDHTERRSHHHGTSRERIRLLRGRQRLRIANPRHRTRQLPRRSTVPMRLGVQLHQERTPRPGMDHELRYRSQHRPTVCTAEETPS